MSNYGTIAEAPATYTNKVLAGAVALAFILGAAAAAVVAPNIPTPVQALDSAAPLCNSSVETSVVDATIPILVDAFNTGWPALADSSGLDPWMDVVHDQVDISCGDYCALPGLYESCVSRGGYCDKSFINLDLTEMQGLDEFVLDAIDVDSMTVNADDASCAAPDGSACAFSASFPVTAQLASGAQIKLTFSDLNFQCKCTGTFGGAFQTDPVNLGTETCTSTDAKAKGTLTACFAGCDPGGAITSANLTKFEIEDSTTVTCDSDKGFWADVQNLIMQPFLKDIYGAVNEPIEEAINGEFKTLIDGNDLETCGGS